MTLAERTSSLKTRCRNLETLDEKIEEARNLGTRLGELRGAMDKLPARLETLGMLRQAGIAIDAQARSASRVRGALAKVKGRFAQDRRCASLTRGQDWNVLMRELARVIDEVGESASASWKKHADRLFTGDAPAAVERTLALTDGNKAALQRYRQAYGRYAALRANVPASATEIAELARVADELKQVKFDHNVPASVRTFLEALPRGAPLTLLTDEVRQWIEEKGLTNRYLVVPDSR
jgi:phage shock protein A